MNQLSETTTSSGLDVQYEDVEGYVTRKPLTVQHKKFGQLIASGELTQTDCYLEVFKTLYEKKNNKQLTRRLAGNLSSQLMANMRLRAYVDKIRAQAASVVDVTVNEVISRHKEIADFDVRKIFNWERIEILDKFDESYNPKRYRMELTAKSMDDIPPEAWNVIESVSQGRDGFIIKLASKQKALEAMGKWLGLDKQIVEQTGNVTLNFDKQDERL